MKKGLLMLLAVASAFAVATQSLAGGSRLAGMAADARITEDQNLVFTYPNKALEYSNTVDVRLGALSAFGGGVMGDEWGGFMLKEDDLGVLGLYANRPGAATANGFFTYLAPGFNPTAIELFWAKDLEGLNLGLQLLYAAHRDHGNDDNYQDFGANIGLGFTSDAFSQINLHASFETASMTLGGFDGTGTPMVISAGALVQKDVDNDHFMRIFGDVRLDMTPIFTNVIPESSAIAWDLGLGCVKKVNGGKATISSGLIVTQSSVSVGPPTTNFMDATLVNWSTSVEASVNSWLVVRTGFSKPLYSSFDKVTDGAFAFATGATVNWQNFTLDLNITPASLQNLFGNPEVGGGIFYPSSNNVGLVTVASADLSYKF